MTPDAAGRPEMVGQMPAYIEGSLRRVAAGRPLGRGKPRTFALTPAEASAVIGEIDRLRAEVEALVPLAQAGLAAFDYAMAKEQYGTAILPRLDRVAIAESLIAARALLAARKGEG